MVTEEAAAEQHPRKWGSNHVTVCGEERSRGGKVKGKVQEAVPGRLRSSREAKRRELSGQRGESDRR